MAGRAEVLLDEARIYVKGGDGGSGSVSFRREKYVPFGGPDGGDGGSGGAVVLSVDAGLATFREFQRRRHFRAGRGGHGRGKGQHGKKGTDLVVKVPPGTQVRAGDELLADLIRPDECVLVARGGRRGRGNARFTTPTNRAPRMAERGEPGEERWLELELKIIADVGIVGCPNAGKSSLLAAISAARPKIGDYPFTTLAPNLGVAGASELDFVVADMPGLIAGAHQGAGVGHRFLRHIERTRTLVHVVDAATEDPLGDYGRLREELRLFDESLVDKRYLVAVNKLDLPKGRRRWPELLEAFRAHGVTALGISALTGEGVQALVEEVGRLLASLPPQPAAPESVRVYRLEPKDSGWTVEREGVAYRVRGKAVERAVAMTDLGNREAVERLQRTLGRMRLLKALEQAGVQAGDTVRIGGADLEWAEDLR